MQTQTTYDPDETFFNNRVKGIAAQLAEADVTRALARANTYVYINADTGLWDAIDISGPFGVPTDDYGQGGYFLGSLDGGWLQYF